MAGSKIVVARKDSDARTGDYKDMSLHSDLNLQKVVKRKVANYVYGISSEGVPNPTTISHGLNYPPEVLLMEEYSANTLMGNGIDPFRLDYTPSFPLNKTMKWYCPSGVESVVVECWGGGGAGGGIVTDNVAGGGGGGAGGQYAKKTVNVVSGTAYNIRIGGGGVGTTGNGGNGGDTFFGDNIVVAKGGAGGKSYENGGAGGIGSTSGGIGDVVYKGGNGGVFHLDENNSPTTAEGGGGAGATGDGGNALGSSWPNPGGLGRGVEYTSYTGNGAYGMFASTNGYSGYPAGGGGGGGGNTFNFYTTDRIGGNGGAGFLRLTYFRRHNNPRYFGNVGVGAGVSAGKIGETTIDAYPVGGFAYGKIVHEIFPSKMWFEILLDPIKYEGPTIPPLIKKIPAIKVYAEGEGESDYLNKINTYYDTIKIAKTGRLSVTAPQFYASNGQNLEQIVEAKVAHGLGYIPMFAPFVDSKICLDTYVNWLNQYYYRGNWATSVNYYLNETVNYNGGSYKCIRSHTSSSSNEPMVGVDSSNYWEIDTPLSFDGLVLNALEDIKFRFGGVFNLDTTNVEYYATENDLVLRIVRQLHDGEVSGEGTNSTLPQITIHVDYTVFYNNAEEECDMTLDT